MQQTISGAAEAIPRLEHHIEALTAAAERLTPTRGDQFRMQIGDRVHTARADAAEALQNRIHRECYNGYIRPLEPGPWGEIAGQPLTYSQHPRTGVSVHFAGLDITVTDQPNDVFKPKLGFIQRLENAAAAIPDGIRQAQIAILERQRSADQAQANVGKPFKHADAIAHKARIEAQLHPDQQSPQAASISTHLAATEAALQGPANPPSTAPATYERPPAAARPAGLRIG